MALITAMAYPPRRQIREDESGRTHHEVGRVVSYPGYGYRQGEIWCTLDEGVRYEIDLPREDRDRLGAGPDFHRDATAPDPATHLSRPAGSDHPSRITVLRSTGEACDDTRWTPRRRPRPSGR